MEEVIVATDTTSYPVYIGKGLLRDAAAMLRNVLNGRSKALIVTDETVAPLYGDDLLKSLEVVIPVAMHIVPAGESSKSMAVYEQVLTACMKEGLDRKSIIIALGGGVIGDLAGFAAATYMRGIPFVQVPTTLLAQDSSVGGKTGINHELGKNLIGAFHQPEAVLYDTETLSSLPDKEWRSGFAEMVKHAYIKDPEFLAWLKENVHSEADIKKDHIRGFLKRSISIKADIVKQDEKESGVRAFLNFGHTLGHALEKITGYGELTHGEAVACGMIFAMRVSNELSLSSWDIAEEASWLQALGYPVDAADRFTADELITIMKHDKKANAGDITFVLLREVGQPFLQTVEERLLHSLLTQAGWGDKA
ncbi:3-dehydroquinate synthase [Bacillus piscicola]|uniref:3-dehydroquinate synthase n=1 Tax=Bacillus piscicola TaxID=1632684 RepID=UPI001F08CB60|nr:3-dehydroquinate synthase [Bacillus piscicola]